MSFSIQLSADLISVEAGDNAPLDLVVVNRGEEVDRFEVEVEGLDSEWTAIPVPVFSVQHGETQSERIFFHPARAPESLAGNYPFVVKVRSLNSGEAKQAQGVLQIKPYNHLSMEITPKKGSVSMRGSEVYHASVMNLGNTEQTLQINGSDPEDAFVFEFGQEQVNVGPGQQKDIEIRATPTSKRPFSSPRLHVFTVSGRSIQTPSLVTTSTAQIEQRPIITLAGLVLVALALAIALFWWESRPQPPEIASFVLDPSQASYEEGTTIRAVWKALHATSVEITVDGQTRSERPEGSISFNAQKSGMIEAVAMSGRTSSRVATIPFEVTQPKVEPPATIDQFQISPRDINTGQTAIVKYKVTNASKLWLEPQGAVLDPGLDSQEIKLDRTDKYYLVAENAEGKRVTSAKIPVRVTEASAAHVVFFDIQPRVVDPTVDDKATITWQTTDAAKVMLSANGKTVDLTQNPGTSGETQVRVDETIEFYLVVYDAKGLTARSQKITVKVKPMIPPTNPPAETGTTGGTTGATTGNNNPPTTTAGGGG